MVYSRPKAMIRCRFLILWPVVVSAISGSVSVSAEYNNKNNSNSMAGGDEFLKLNQRECFFERNIVSCIKYKAAKVLWKVATNKLGYFPNENSRNAASPRTWIRIVQLAVPSDKGLENFSSRELKDDAEITKIMKFLHRTAELFARNHGIQIEISDEGGTRISSDEDNALAEPRAKLSRGDRKKRKWLLILPLIILMKIAHLKMTVVPLLLATLGLNVILIGGGGWLIHYLKYKTLCKIHPHFIQTHSHVYETDPSEYSSFVGSTDGFSSAQTAGAYYSPQDQGLWSNRKNFHAYGGYKIFDRKN